MYAHLFENTEMGVARAVFLVLQVECDPVDCGGHGPLPCGVLVEWITLPGGAWKRLSELEVMIDESISNGAEASLYLQEHFPAADGELVLKHASAHNFDVDLSLRAHVLIPRDIDNQVVATLRTQVPFTEFVVVPRNLSNVRDEVDSVLEAAAPWITLSDFEAPYRDGFRWVFQPRPCPAGIA
jgi:hypothetical protein